MRCASRCRRCASGSESRRSSRRWQAAGIGSAPMRNRGESGMDRAPGMSVRLKLTLSYAGFLMVAGALLLGAVWVFLLRYVPDKAMLVVPRPQDLHGVFPVRSNLLRVFAPRAFGVLVFLLVFGLVGGWILAGRMLAPLARITEATRLASSGSLSHRIALDGPEDEFRELADAFDTMLGQLEPHV